VDVRLDENEHILIELKSIGKLEHDLKNEIKTKKYITYLIQPGRRNPDIGGR